MSKQTVECSDGTFNCVWVCVCVYMYSGGFKQSKHLSNFKLKTKKPLGFGWVILAPLHLKTGCKDLGFLRFPLTGGFRCNVARNSGQNSLGW